MNKPLAKSLHTVSVLVKLSRFIQEATSLKDNEASLKAALVVLGYDTSADPHGLAEAALKQLNK